MFWTDPNLYGATFFGETGTQVPFTPWMQKLPGFTPYNVLPFHKQIPFPQIPQIPEVGFGYNVPRMEYTPYNYNFIPQFPQYMPYTYPQFGQYLPFMEGYRNMPLFGFKPPFYV